MRRNGRVREVRHLVHNHAEDLSLDVEVVLPERLGVMTLECGVVCSGLGVLGLFSS